MNQHEHTTKTDCRFTTDNQPVELFCIRTDTDEFVGSCIVSDYGSGKFVSQLRIKPSFRRQGYARRLIKYVITTLAQRQNSTTIYLQPVPFGNSIEKEELETFYFSLGFQRIESEENLLYFDLYQHRTGVQIIKKERQRQIEIHGFNAANDDQYQRGELIEAAIAYAEAARWLKRGASGEFIKTATNWPWDLESWKPSADIARNLAKAGALIAAAIDLENRNRPDTTNKPDTPAEPSIKLH